MICTCYDCTVHLYTHPIVSTDIFSSSILSAGNPCEIRYFDATEASLIGKPVKRIALY